MNLTLLYIILAVLAVWVVLLSLIFAKFYFSIQRISRGLKKDTIIDILNELLVRDKNLEKDLNGIEAEVKRLSFESQFYINKIGLVRFNPFNDTGGDQSFILALVDIEDSGVVISGLHTRNGTRWYAKRVENGKGIEHALSDDEIKAIKSATKRHKKTNG
jgi:hypothetical protein